MPFYPDFVCIVKAQVRGRRIKISRPDGALRRPYCVKR